MPNARLQILLDRCPLGDEDCHNIAVIFEALSPTRQQHILDHWETYIVDMVMVRKEADNTISMLVENTLDTLDTLRDAKNAYEAELKMEKMEKKKETRRELENTVAFGQLQKLKKIKAISHL